MGVFCKMLKNWQCIKCGDCCKDFGTENKGKGLILDFLEARNFDKKHLTPFVGNGKDKANIDVLIYVMKTQPCPLYDKNIGCKIHKNKPLICKLYPFTPELGGLITICGCKEKRISELIESNPGSINGITDLKTNPELFKNVKLYLRNQTYLYLNGNWKYNHILKKWRKICKY